MATEKPFQSDPFFEPPRDKHHEFTYTWTIENLAFWAKRPGEYLETDVFRPRLIDEGFWQLRLYPRTREEPLMWYLERVCGDTSDTAQLSFSLKVYSGYVLHYQYQADDHVFKKGSGAAFTTEKKLKDMVKQASVHQIQDALKVVCKMWRRCPAVALSEKLASCTRIEIGRLAFSWHFTQFSCWDPHQQHTHAGYTYGNAVHDILSCKMQLYSNRDPIFERLGVIVRFRRQPTEDFLVAAKISVLNKDGKAVVSYEETIFEKAGDDIVVWVIPVFIDKGMLVEESSEYLPYDELTLLSEFNIPVRNIYSVRLQYSIASGSAQQNLENTWKEKAIASCLESVSTQASGNVKALVDSGMQTEDVSESEQELSFDGLDFCHQTVKDEDHLVNIDKHSLLRLLDQLDVLASSEIQKETENEETVVYHSKRVFGQKTNNCYDRETLQKSATSGDYGDSEETDSSGSDSVGTEGNCRSCALNNPKPSIDHNYHENDEESQESSRSGKDINKVINPKLKMELCFRQKGTLHSFLKNDKLEKVAQTLNVTLMPPSATSDESGSSDEGSTSEESDSSYEGSTSEDSDSSQEPSVSEEGLKDIKESLTIPVVSRNTEDSISSSDEDETNNETDSSMQNTEHSSTGDRNNLPSQLNHSTRRHPSLIHQLLDSLEELIITKQRKFLRFFMLLNFLIWFMVIKNFLYQRSERTEIPRFLVLHYADTIDDPHMTELVWAYSSSADNDSKILECSKIASSLSTENAWVVLALAVAHQDKVLKRTALQFLEANKDKTLQSVEWRKSVELKIDSAHGVFRKRLWKKVWKEVLKEPSPPIPLFDEELAP